MILEAVECVFSGHGHSYLALAYAISYSLGGKSFVCQKRLDETAFRMSIIVTQVKLWLVNLHIIIGPKLVDGLWKRPQRSRLAHQDE